MNFSNSGHQLAFGAVLVAVNLVVVGSALFVGLRRVAAGERKRRAQQERRATKIEWACHFNKDKFATTMDAVENADVPPSHCMLFHYTSMTASRQALAGGLQARHFSSISGILFTCHRPYDLDTVDEAAFTNRESVLCVIIPRRLLLCKGQVL